LKRLYILRHAKSDWNDSSLSDFERPLNDRGRSTAPFMGELISKKGWMPDVIFSSPAERALRTAQLVKDSAGSSSPLILDDRIYEASPRTLKLIVSGLSNEFESVMIVGHNPGIEGFIRLATGRDERMPTASLAVIDFEIADWNDAIDTVGILSKTVRPKDLMKSKESLNIDLERYR
jgi:phosphohistidine phosphatase